MNSEAEAERTLRNLTVLGEIKQNDKLTTYADTFEIYPPTALRGIYRKWQGEARILNFQRIQETVNSACTYITSTRELLQNTQYDVSKEHLKRKCERIIMAMKASKFGLENLSHTYFDDTTSKVRINLVIQQIDDFISIHETSTVRINSNNSSPASVAYAGPLPSPIQLSCDSEEV
tara:strand:- start:84 stop:611 length:528 start_codon:yes stop_codon:yes gene_type:complete